MGGDTPLGALPWKIRQGSGRAFHPPTIVSSLFGSWLLNFFGALYELRFIYFIECLDGRGVYCIEHTGQGWTFHA